jgi:O-antigen/teichoic acid export membrane protein
MTGEHSVARRVAAGTATNLAGQAVVVLSLIALAPIIVHAVGATDYGVWVLIGSVASFGFLIELGISAALVKYVAEHAARAEVQEAARMIGAATWLYTVLGAGVAAAGLVLALAVPAVIDFHGAIGRLARPLAMLMALDVGMSVVAIAPLAVLKGLQRFPVVNAINGAGALVGVGLTIAALAAGAGIVGVAAVGALNSALTYAVSLLVARRTVPEYMAIPIRRDRSRVRRLLKFSRSIAVLQVAVQMQTKLDAVVIAAALPVRLLAPYNFGQRLAAGTGIATDQFGKVLLPLATEVGATRDRAALRALFLTATRLTLAIALGVGLPLALLGGPILKLWVGNAFAGYGTVVTLLAVAAIVDLPSNPAAYVLQSIERHGPIAWMALGSGVANVGLSVALVGPYGINGVAAATLVASTAEIALFVIPYAARVLGVPLREFASEVVLRLATPAVVLAGLLTGGAAILPVNSLLRLAVVVGVALAGYALTYVTLGADRFERAAYRSGASATMRLASRQRALRSNTSEHS